MNYDRVDKELAKYADAARIDITPEENKRLKRMIDRRVLVVMVVTYFIQALDKGTMYVLNQALASTEHLNRTGHSPQSWA